MRRLGGEDATVFRNRYRNTMRFLDDAIMDAVGSLDPARTVVVVIGDHGESLFDDGRWGHGYSFADVIAETPAILVGPGIEPRRRTDATLHADLVPTLVHAVTQGAAALDGVDGVDLLDPSVPFRASTLLAAADVGRDLSIAELRSGTDRLDLQIHLKEGTAVWDGLRGPDGRRTQNQRITPEKRRSLVQAFTAAVGSVARR
jgi:arylsulfatase A-like enzyme